MKAYFKLLMLILISTLYYGCSQDPYDWTGGKTTVTIKEISSPIVRSDMIQIQTKLDIGGAKIDKITFVLYKNKEGNWEYEDEKTPSLVEGTSDTYFFEFSDLTANTQYKVIIRIWINNSEEPIIEQEQYVTTASAKFTLQTVDAIVRNQYVVELYGKFQSEEIKATQEMLGFIVSKTDINLEAGDLRPCLEISSDGSFSAVADGLNPGTNYYYAACFVHEGKQYLGETKSFCTQDIEITEGKVIDLGLDVKWASCNLGSDTPEGFGAYYGWGDPHGGSSMNRDDYPKLDSISGSGYDAAWYQLGEYNRMPTADEWETLKSKCTWEWVTYKNVDGYKITGPNGNSIFLPAAGCRWMSDGGIGYVGVQGFYRIGTQAEIGDYVDHFLLTSDKYYSNTSPREWGCSIRPVYDDRITCITGGSTNITATSASILEGYVKSSNDFTPKEWGIWYGTKEYPNIREGVMCKTNNQNLINVELKGLFVNTTYYYCTYAKVGNQTYFGKVNKFTTPIESEISTEEVVDLGLSVLWRGYNLNSESPENIGSLYSIRHNNTGHYISGTSFDPTVKLLGYTWRTPDQEEIEELKNECIWVKKEYQGVDGWQVIGMNGNSIFLPIDKTKDSTYYLCGVTYKAVNYYLKSIDLTASTYSISQIPEGTGGYIRPVQNK